MTEVLAAVLTAILALGQPQATLRAQATVAADVVRLGDVADLAGTPQAWRARASVIPVARFTPGQAHMVLAGATVAERVRGAVPVLAAWSAQLAPARIEVTRRAPPPTVPASLESCLRALRPLPAGAVAVRVDFEATPCGPRALPLAYDRGAGLARTREALDAGDLVRGLPEHLLSAVRPGQDLVLRAAAGPVVVERRVEVLRAARPGAAVYVRSDDGATFAAPPPQPGHVG